MRPFFHPRLINGPFGDPGLFISFSFDHRAILVDTGNIQGVSPGDLMKVGYLLVSHAHMDHFIGFDFLVRRFLGREKTLWVVGPEGIIEKVGAKLNGYTWNLVDTYPDSLEIHVVEIREATHHTQRFSCRRRFIPETLPQVSPAAPILQPATDFSITPAILDHGIPCLGFAIEEPFHVHIRTDGLTRLGLLPGPWLKRFKQALQSGSDPETRIEADTAEKAPPIGLRLGELAPHIARIGRGQKIAYITDAAFTEENIRRILTLASAADTLFIEAAFSEEHRAIAAQKAHLTAAQAGILAARARVARFTLFHFSPRYAGMHDTLMAEANSAYEKERLRVGAAATASEAGAHTVSQAFRPRMDRIRF